MDLFATALAAAGVALPTDRVIDGQDLLPVLAGKAHSRHDVIFGHAGPQLATVRDGRWKLHVLPARDRRDDPPGERWIDPRAPDGVTILAPFEQSQPAEYPGLRTGDETQRDEPLRPRRRPGRAARRRREAPRRRGPAEGPVRPGGP